MKKPLFYVVSLLLTIAFAMVSCSKDKITLEELDPDPEPEDEYMVICEKAAEVYEQVLKIYDECSSIEDLEAQESKIRAIENVEDVYFTDISMFVDIKDFGTISYSFYPETKIKFNDGIITHNVKTRNYIEGIEAHPLLGYNQAIIIDQQTKLQSDPRDWTSLINDVVFFFDKMGINTQVEDDPQIELFEDDIYKKDIVFIIAHGTYDPKKELHWLSITSQPIAVETILEDYEEKDYFFYVVEKYKEYIVNKQVKFDITTNEAGKRFVSLQISEKFISAQSERFRNEGNPIIFSVACKSLMGPGKKSDLRDTINYSFAKAFIDRGAGVYLGYDASNWAGQSAGYSFFGRLLSNLSIGRAYESLPFHLKHNTTKFFLNQQWADLLYYPNESLRLKDYCLIAPVLQDHNYAPGGNGFPITLIGNAYQVLNEALKKGEEFFTYFSTSSNLTYGFVLSETEDFSSSVFLKGLYVGEDGCSIDNDSYYVTFQQILSEQDLKPNTTYYYKAYFFDGVNTYYSRRTNSFKTPDRKTDITGGGTLPDVPGTDF